METKEMLARLLRGSRNIDRMREEVDSIIKIIIGCLRAAVGVVGMDERLEVVCSDGSQWVIEIVAGPKGKSRDSYDIQLVPVGDAQEKRCVYSSRAGAALLQVEIVPVVHEKLPSLLGGLLSLCPELESKFALFLNVSSLESQSPMQ